MDGQRQGLWRPQVRRRLRDQGEARSKNRGARLASLAGVAAQIGYRRRPCRYGGKPAVVADKTLRRPFQGAAPGRVWVTDITTNKTHDGWLYLSVVIDLFSMRVADWSAQSRITTDLAVQALLARCDGATQSAYTRTTARCRPLTSKPDSRNWPKRVSRKPGAPHLRGTQGATSGRMTWFRSLEYRSRDQCHRGLHIAAGTRVMVPQTK